MRYIPPFIKWFIDTNPPIVDEPKYRLATTSELKRVYGNPEENPNYLATIQLPYPMRLSWDTDIVVNKMRCHKSVAADLLNIFYELQEAYGIIKIQELGIDLFGGCFNFRKMRGGSDWSRHSWGIAIDLDPERNGLRTPFKKAQFSKPEYKEMFRIFEKYGFLNLGKEKNYDSMHFEKCIKI
jgi:hypothetical protein